MYCPSCGKVIAAIGTADLVSMDRLDSNYYTHKCVACNTHWHLHLSNGIDLISTRDKETIANKKITDDMAAELRKRADQISPVVTLER